MKQIICPKLKEMIKGQIEIDGKCSFQFDYINDDYCHFLTNPECGHYGEMQMLDLPKRQEFYRCRLPIQMEFKW